MFGYLYANTKLTGFFQNKNQSDQSLGFNLFWQEPKVSYLAKKLKQYIYKKSYVWIFIRIYQAHRLFQNKNQSDQSLGFNLFWQEPKVSYLAKKLKQYIFKKSYVWIYKHIPSSQAFFKTRTKVSYLGTELI